MKTFKTTDWDTDAMGDDAYQELFKKSKSKKKKSKSKFLAGKVEKGKKKVKLKKIMKTDHTDLIETINLISVQSNHQKLTNGQRESKRKKRKPEVNGVEQETTEQTIGSITQQKKLKFKKSKRKVSGEPNGIENGISKEQTKMLKKLASELNSLNDHSDKLSREMLREKKRQRKLQKKLEKARKKERLLSNVVETTIKSKFEDSEGIKAAKKTKKEKKELLNTAVIDKEKPSVLRTGEEKKKKKEKQQLQETLHSENKSGQSKQEESISKAKRKKLQEKLKTVLSQAEMKQNKPILSLRQKMMEKLKAARFRFLNEQIYTTDSKEAQKIFKSDPEAFNAYHEGYRQQVRSWPLNPLDVIIKNIKNMPKTHKIADFGCGDAKLAKSVQQKVHSFDLVAVDDRVTACDMAKVPLQDGSIDVGIFCLSLMGTNLHDYLIEANRVLKIGGTLKIAEVESRFDNVDNFIEGVQRFGFKITWKDLSHNLFYFLDFKKNSNVKNKKKLPTISLLPCLYKKR